ncbi:class I SAM-dependent methyltransferase [Magnetospira sp. QH-2]|uniref:class I SAM-dependent methyltransferase n=1 Tax=Magnetospira sp. (strain QH-2) TaxID=1288970 RepID=UPI0003E81497|nr:class I SAM-dependent methyltransferase [Magnetospira sp. QH-2]CCQ73069.1 conserved protein of unknown function [Magnetospira sp. QH-2]
MSNRTPPLRRYGKASAEYLGQSAALSDPEQDRVMRHSKQRLLDIYRQQPLRTSCKVCGGPLPNGARENIPYYLFCPACGHANGRFEDTQAYHDAYYGTGQGEDDVAQAYGAETAEAFGQRVADIYLPKAMFLRDVIVADGHDPAGMSCVDFGAGSGYFVEALHRAGFAAKGYEVSAKQVDLGNRMMDRAALEQTDFAHTLDIVRTLEADILSMIFVLEHVRDHHRLLEAVRDNRRIKYFFFSVPLHGVTAFWEAVFPNVYARCTSGHNHLYTPQSLTWMAEKYGFREAGSWWFGADVTDLMRSVALGLHQRYGESDLTRRWTEAMLPMIDSLQRVMDERKLSSEVHMLLATDEKMGDKA